MNRILVGIIFSLFITTGYIAYLVYDRQQELQKLTQYTESGPWHNWYQSITVLNHGLVYTQPIPMTLR